MNKTLIFLLTLLTLVSTASAQAYANSGQINQMMMPQEVEEGSEGEFSVQVRNRGERKLEGEVAFSYKTSLTTLTNYYDIEVAPESTETIEFTQNFVKDAKGRTYVQAGETVKFNITLYNDEGRQVDINQGMTEIVQPTKEQEQDEETEAPPIPGEEVEQDKTKAPPIPGQSTETNEQKLAQNSTNQSPSREENTTSQDNTQENNSSIVARIISALPFL